MVGNLSTFSCVVFYLLFSDEKRLKLARNRVRSCCLSIELAVRLPLIALKRLKVLLSRGVKYHSRFILIAYSMRDLGKSLF